MKIFFDSDVVFDVLIDRRPYSLASSKVIDLTSAGHSGFIAAHSISNLHFLISRHLSKSGKSGASREATRILSHFLVNVTVASLTDKLVRRSLTSDMEDFEDSLVYHCAESVRADVLVTRNIKDYPREASVPAIFPEALLELIT